MRARGNTVLFSTHYLEEADDNADRIVVIDHGRVVADGSGEQLKRVGRRQSRLLRPGRAAAPRG